MRWASLWVLVFILLINGCSFVNYAPQYLDLNTNDAKVNVATLSSNKTEHTTSDVDKETIGSSNGNSNISN